MAAANKGEGVKLPDGSAGRTSEEADARVKRIGLLVDHGSRAVMVVAIAAIFLGLNYWTVDFIGRVFDADVAASIASPGSDRVITSNVVMALIGATVVQTGVAIAAIVSYLFKSRDL